MTELHAPRKARTGFIPSVLLAVILNPLNSATISVGLVTILRALHASSAGILWIVSGYYLGSAVAQPIMGAWGDRLGYRRFVYLGFGFILLTAVLAPLSHNLWIFVGWRVVQAIGTSMVYPNAIGLVRRWETKRLAAVLGWIGMAAGVALAIGPPLGGLLMDRFGWQSIFWLNIPIVLAAGILLGISVPGDPAQPPSPRLARDWAGSAWFTLTMIFGLLATSGAVPGGGFWFAILAAAAIAALIRVERRAPRPVIPVAWFRIPLFSLLAAVTVLTNLVMYSALYGIPVLLETRRHLSVRQSGFMLLIFAGSMALGSPLGGRLAKTPLRRTPYLASAALLPLASALIWVGAHRGLWMMGLALALMGLSFAVSNVVLQQMVLEIRPPGESGSASGLYSLMRYVGTMASSVVIALAFAGPRTLNILYLGLLSAGVLATGLGLGFPATRAAPVEVS